MELEVKHLAPYLPYGLKLQYVEREKVISTGIMKSISHNNSQTHQTMVSINYLGEEYIWMYKPILRPLSDLAKEIEFNGEKFMPYKKLESELLSEGHLTFGESEYGWVGFYSKEYKINLPIYFDNEIMGECDYTFYKLLISWHFDIFNLIEKGLAVDINTLPK